MDLFAKRNPEKSQRTQEIKSRVVRLLGLNEDATVMVTELNCRDEDCPEVETVIAIFQPGRPKLQATLPSSIEDLTGEEIERFCRNMRTDLQKAEAAASPSEANDQTL